MHRLARWLMAGLTLLAAFAVAAWALNPVLSTVGTPAIVVMVVAALVGLHLLLDWAEGRGWIYYRKHRGSYGGLGVTSNFLNMYDPSRRHLQEATRVAEWKRDEDDDGDGEGGDDK